MGDHDSFPRLLTSPSGGEGKTFLEPLAGGGTGVGEASIYGFSSFGIDVNPVAYHVMKGYTSLQKGINLDQNLLIAAQKVTKDLWFYKGNLVSYVFVTRGKVPTWIYTSGRAPQLLCPRCGRVWGMEVNEIEIRKHPKLLEGRTVRCPHCGDEFRITIKPEYDPVSPVRIGRWMSFGFLTSDRRGVKNFFHDLVWTINYKAVNEKLQRDNRGYPNVVLRKLK
ncbi:hypothetical protein IC006_0416 [Sulfuracidifex tepidarius]|uniref:DNA methylase N-4/N-6 domain-containing protein n=1 Tax=Sulfuracidifex tepidarius TaxID=1294262 RepID=A0A510DSH4_9CREN|nr:hypothetical protein [Sulfuracidifex tepidarius]BBG23132.1 hypothetical protein IC006_0416 [Sulfuracidifex tepidarius]